MQPWVRGFIRFSIVLFFLVWIGLTFIAHQQNLGRSEFRIYEKISPLRSSLYYTISDRTWCAILASDDFLSRPENERLKVADRFFEEQIEESARKEAFDITEFRNWFRATATLSLDEATIGYRPSMRLPNQDFLGNKDLVKCRDLSQKPMPKPRPVKVLFHPKILAGSFIISAGVMVIITISFLVLRWVIRGFKKI